MTAIESLLERVRAATGADREIEGEIAFLLSQAPAWATVRRESYRWTDSGIGLRAREWMPPFYTSSVDAILALIERELPGWRVAFDAIDGIAEDVYLLGPEFQSDGSRPDQESEPFAGMPTALALCAAFLSALLAKEKADG